MVERGSTELNRHDAKEEREREREREIPTHSLLFFETKMMFLRNLKLWTVTRYLSLLVATFFYQCLKTLVQMNFCFISNLHLRRTNIGLVID